MRRPGRPAYWTRGPEDRRRIALTFDDGPGVLTERILDVLGKHGARATFNVLGERLHGREAVLRRTVAEGHELGNHAMRHESLAGRPLAAVRQVRATNAGVRRITGFAPTLFRPPYGHVSWGLIRAVRAIGMTTVGWDVDPRDYETPGEEAIYARVVQAARPGSIVLLHDDRRALEQTVLALERILDALAASGYRFVTASELLGGR